jgi:hypothetical protein
VMFRTFGFWSSIAVAPTPGSPLLVMWDLPPIAN